MGWAYADKPKPFPHLRSPRRKPGSSAIWSNACGFWIPAFAGMSANRECESDRHPNRATLPRMNPHIRLMLQQVWPLFWPWLFWNLARAAEWQKRTGRDALISVDRFGNIHFLVLGDAPAPDDLYSYEAPKVPRWERPALGSDLPQSVSPGAASPSWSIHGPYMAAFMVPAGRPARVRGPP